MMSARAGSWAILCTGLGLSLGQLGCVLGRECTLIGCDPHAEVELRSELELSDDDKLEVELDDGTKVECTASASSSSSECSDSSVRWLFRSIETRSMGGATLTAGGKPVGIYVRGKPKTIELRLYRSGQVAGQAPVKPQYIGTEINGPGCGTCDIAHEAVTLSPP